MFLNIDVADENTKLTGCGQKYTRQRTDLCTGGLGSTRISRIQ